MTTETTNEQTAAETPVASKKPITADDLLDIPAFLKRSKNPDSESASAGTPNRERNWTMPKSSTKTRTAKSVRTDPAVLAEKRRKKVEAAEARAARKAAKVDKAAKPAKSPNAVKAAKSANARNDAKPAKDKADRKPRDTSKQAALIEMLRTPKGASIDEIATKMDWQKHTVRGAIAGALKKKLGLNVVAEKVEGRGNVYRIA